MGDLNTCAVASSPHSSPSRRLSGTFKEMIDPKLFEKIQVGFDDYEGLNRHHEDVVDETQMQEDNKAATLRARQAFMANSLAVNSSIKEMKFAKKTKNTSGLEGKLGALLSETKNENPLMCRTGRASRMAIRQQMAREATELAETVTASFQAPYHGEHKQNEWGDRADFRSVEVGVDASTLSLQFMHSSLANALERKERHLDSIVRHLVKSKKIKRSTANRFGLKKLPAKKSSTDNVAKANVSDKQKGKKKTTRTTVRKKKRSLKKKVAKVPKTKTGRINLALALLTRGPKKMSKGTKKRLYAKKSVRAKSTVSKKRIEDNAKPKLFRSAF